MQGFRDLLWEPPSPELQNTTFLGGLTWLSRPPLHRHADRPSILWHKTGQERSEELVYSLPTRVTCVGCCLHETSWLRGDNSACGLSSCLDIFKRSSSAGSQRIPLSAGAVDELPFAQLCISVNLFRSGIRWSVTSLAGLAACGVHSSLVRWGRSWHGSAGPVRTTGFGGTLVNRLPALPVSWKREQNTILLPYRGFLIDVPAFQKVFEFYLVLLIQLAKVARQHKIQNFMLKTTLFFSVCFLRTIAMHQKHIW